MAKKLWGRWAENSFFFAIHTCVKFSPHSGTTAAVGSSERWGGGERKERRREIMSVEGERWDRRREKEANGEKKETEEYRKMTEDRSERDRQIMEEEKK